MKTLQIELNLANHEFNNKMEFVRIMNKLADEIYNSSNDDVEYFRHAITNNKGKTLGYCSVNTEEE